MDVEMPEKSSSVAEVSLHAEYFHMMESTLAEITVSLSIINGWHINGPTSDARRLIPTSVDLRGKAVKAIIDIIYPRALLRAMPEDKLPRETYEGDIELVIHAEVNEKLIGQEGMMRVALRYQPCSSNGCFKPVDLVLPVTNLIERKQIAFI